MLAYPVETDLAGRSRRTTSATPTTAANSLSPRCNRPATCGCAMANCASRCGRRRVRTAVAPAPNCTGCSTRRRLASRTQVCTFVMRCKMPVWHVMGRGGSGGLESYPWRHCWSGSDRRRAPAGNVPMSPALRNSMLFPILRRPCY